MRKKQRDTGQPKSALPITRRQLLAGAGTATVLTSMGTGAVARRRAAAAFRPALPAPKAIPGGVDAPPVGFIHWFLPGPPGSVTPFNAIPGFGLDVEPSTLTDFSGFTAFAVISGEAEGSDGNIYDVEFDVRVMQGEYIAEDGSAHHGTFGFF